MKNFILIQHLFLILFLVGSHCLCVCTCGFGYLCLTVDPAARGATVLLGERPDAPTLVEIAAGIR